MIQHPTHRGVLFCYDGVVKLTLSGQPLSTQHCYLYTARYGSVRGYMKSECKTLKEQWQWEARSQWQGAPLTGELRMEVTLYHGDKRRRDVDNYHKLCGDCLTGIVYEDDSQVAELTIRRAFDKDRPRIEVVINTIACVRIA